MIHLLNKCPLWYIFKLHVNIIIQKNSWYIKTPFWSLTIAFLPSGYDEQFAMV